MAPRRVDVTNQRFGQLVAIKQTNSRGSAVWLCRCDCGKEKEIKLGDLRLAKSCGCQRYRLIAEALKGKIPFTKGKTILEICKGDVTKAEKRLAQCRENSKKGADLQRGKAPWNKGVIGWKQRRPNPHRNTKGKNYKERYGVERAIEIARKVGNTRKRSYLWPEENKKRFSNLVQQNILSGKTTPHTNRWKKKEEIETLKGGVIYCQSSWEVIFAKYLDNNLSILKFTKDKVRIFYSYRGKKRIYIVDFLITYVDNSQELVEIKPKCFLELNENPAKFEAARNWCKEQNINFVIITEDEIKFIRGNQNYESQS